MDNGPGRELSTLETLQDNVSYCVDCGTVMVFQRNRECPACHINEKLGELLEEGDDA